MADPLRTEDVSPTSPLDREVTVRDRWNELRTLLLDPERRRLKAVEQKLESATLHVDEVSRLLPEAVTRRGPGDRALSQALGPVVGDAIKASVRKDPQPLVDAVFPIIGPAIRRAIATAFSELVQSVNTSLEHSLTPRGLAWRFEAMRTGKSFGEVVLSHSLVYRAEQLFVIHRESGLLIEHITLPGVQVLSPDMVAGMLTAIADFARDSFQVSQQEGLDAFALGDLSVWVEQGPQATIASVMRGQAPADYRETLQRAVEALHRTHAEDIERSAATGQGFALRSDVLEPCLVSQLQRAARGARPWRLVAIAGLVLLGVGWCAVPRALQARRFGQYLTTLRAEPGVVVGSSARTDGRYLISGLRDPIARDPVALLSAHGLDTADVAAHWEPYVALRPEFVVRRAIQALRPAAAVQLTMRGDTLVASGVASQQWVERAGQLAPALAGVVAVDIASLRDSAYESLSAHAASISGVVLTFARGVTALSASERPKADSLALALRALASDASSSAWTLDVHVRGAADSVGSAASNALLRLARARGIRQGLIARGVDPASLTIGTDTSSVRQARVAIDIVPRR